MPGFVRNIWFLMFGVTLLAVVLLGLTMWHSVQSTLVQAVEGQNRTLVATVQRRLGPDFPAQLMRLSEASLTFLRQDPESQRINKSLQSLAADSSQLRINIYDPAGGMVFSSAPELIGADWNRYPDAFDEARRGKIQSTLSLGATLWTVAKPMVDQDLVVSHLPVFGGSKVVGVLELFTDVGDQTATLTSSVLTQLAVLSVPLLVLFFFLHRFSRQAETVYGRQQRDLGIRQRREQELATSLQLALDERSGYEQTIDDNHFMLDLAATIDDADIEITSLLAGLMQLTKSEYGFVCICRYLDNDEVIAGQALASRHVFPTEDGTEDFEVLAPDAPHVNPGDLADLFTADGELQSVTGPDADSRTILRVPLHRRGRLLGIAGLSGQEGEYDLVRTRRMDAIFAALVRLIEIRLAEAAQKYLAERVVSTRRFSASLLDAMPVAAFTLDDEGRLFSCNLALEELLGKKNRDMKGLEIANFLVPPELRHNHRGDIAGTLSNLKPDNQAALLEIPVAGRDGYRFEGRLSLTCSPFDPDHKFICALSDLSEQARLVAKSRRGLDYLAVSNAVVETVFGPPGDTAQLTAMLTAMTDARAFGANAAAALYSTDPETGPAAILLAQAGQVNAEMDVAATLEPAKCVCGRDVGENAADDLAICRHNHTDRLHYHAHIPLQDGRQGILVIITGPDYEQSEAGDQLFAVLASAVQAALRRAGEEAAIRQVHGLINKLEADNRVLTLENSKGRQKVAEAAIVSERTERAVRGRLELLKGMTEAFRTPVDSVLRTADNLVHARNQGLPDKDEAKNLEFIRDTAARLLEDLNLPLDTAALEPATTQINPDDGVSLGNYAVQTVMDTGRHDLAEALFRRAIDIYPGDPVVLKNYSLYRSSLRRDRERASTFFLEAIAAEPKNSRLLTLYAVFLSDVHGNHDEAEEMHKRALTGNREDAVVMRNYALFLWKVREDEEQAEALFKKAVRAEPNNVSVLSDYGSFVRRAQGDHERAAAVFQKALQVDPDDPVAQRELAALKLLDGEIDHGLDLLRAAATRLRGVDLLYVQVLIFSYSRTDVARHTPLLEIRRLLLRGVRDPEFSPSVDVRNDIADNHPESRMIAGIVRVVRLEEDIEALDAFPVWVSLGQIH